MLVQAAALGVMGHYLSSHDAGAYRTLSAAPAPGASATLRVVPDSALTLATWNALLRAHRLQVVNGPNTVGAYGLAPLDGTASNPAAVVEALRRTPGVLLAQALSPGP